MRRPRPHRLTGSVRRLLAAAALGGLAAALAVTVVSRPASAAGLDLNVNLGALNLNSLPVIPNLLPTPTPPAPPTTSAPSLPSTALPTLCPPNCSSTVGGGTPGGTNTPGSKTPGSSIAGSTGPGSTTGSGTGTTSGTGSASNSAAGATLSPPRAGGLSLSPPPPVAQLTPLAGISFGQAPYLWPLFLLLDVVAATAVVMLVRRTWSPKSGAD